MSRWFACSLRRSQGSHRTVGASPGCSTALWSPLSGLPLSGMDGGDALLNGQRWLEMALPSAVMDAGRDATAANIVARPRTGWVRIVNPPCCSRCAVLGTTYYAWNKPNPRHPRCDCLSSPPRRDEADQYLVRPAKLLEQGGITDLSQAQRQRLDDGADLVKVLNESRDRWRVRLAADRRRGWPVDRWS
jgi:hypothetical protein